MRHDWTSLAIVGGIGLVTLGLMAWRTAVAEHLLGRWADDHGLTLLAMRPAMYFRGPFTWTSSGTDFVYRLSVRDARGEVLEGWARIGGPVMGPCSGSVEVRWVEGTPPPAPPRG